MLGFEPWFILSYRSGSAVGPVSSRIEFPSTGKTRISGDAGRGDSKQSKLLLAQRRYVRIKGVDRLGGVTIRGGEVCRLQQRTSTSYSDCTFQ